MRNNSMTKLLSLVLVFVLTAAAALTGCSGKPAETTAPAGSRTFTFIVTDPEGVDTTFQITTTAETVGEALIAEGLIAGEQGDYGLYVKTVNGLTLDYETDGMYWGFYINGEYAPTGVDMAPITDGQTYQMKADAA